MLAYFTIQLMTRPKPPSPFSLRVSQEERRVLKARAGDIPLGRYIRSQLFDGGQNPNVPAEILAKLGKSGLAPSMNRIARAVDLGILRVSPETEEALRAASLAIVEMKSMNMRALGIKER